MIWIRSSITPEPPIDVVIFDVDGILIDDTVSYFAAVKATVRFVVAGLYGRSAQFATISDQEIMAFKAAGGFNDDWVLAYTLCGILLAAPANTRPPLAQIAQQSAGRGMPWVRDQYFPVLPVDLDMELIRQIAIEHYWGKELLKERMGRESIYYHGPGFVALERPLVPAGFFDSLREIGIRRFGIITGRNAIELENGLRTLGFVDRHPFEFVLVAGELYKPDPQALIQAMATLRPARALYIGDTGDDLQLVLNYREHPAKTADCLSAIAPKPGQVEYFIRAGADLVLDSPTELPAALCQIRQGSWANLAGETG